MMVDIIRDSAFQKGFVLASEKRSVLPEAGQSENLTKVSLNHFDEVGRVKMPFQNKEPEWFLEQCFTRYPLALDNYCKIGPRSYSFGNEAKKVERKPGGAIALSLFSHKEYKKPRKLNEGWPLVAISQHYRGEYLSQFKSLSMSMDVTFNSFKDFMGDSFDPKLHTFQVIWYLVVGNLNPKSKGFGDFFFFGLPLVDRPRYKTIKEYNAEDYGKSNATHKFIHLVGNDAFLSKPLDVGDEVSFSHVCYSEVKESFLEAQKRGFMVGSKFDDLEICQTTLWVEAEGTFDGSISINSMKIEKEL